MTWDPDGSAIRRVRSAGVIYRTGSKLHLTISDMNAMSSGKNAVQYPP